MKLPLESITVGKRRREDYGDITGLAESIATYGLLHPIVVDVDGNLVAGERRLRAVESLGWDAVDVRDLGELSEAERDEIELEENLQRKDLTPHEQSKTLTRLVVTSKRVVQESSGEIPQIDEQDGVFTDSVKTPKGGRPAIDGVPLRLIAERIGVPEQTIRDAQKHVEIAEEYPALQAPSWKQHYVLEARKKLEKLSATERPRAIGLISHPDMTIPPRDGVEILGNLATMPVEQRERVLALAESVDSRDRDLALTEAAKQPPMPDPRVDLLTDASMALGKAERLFPGDAMNGHITIARTTVRDVLAQLKEYRRDA